MAEDAETPILVNAFDDAVDYKGRRVPRSSSGGWRSAVFIIGVEVAERFAYYGISSNLVSYLSGPLGQSTAAAAANVNAWGGAAAMLPLLGAFVADSFLGRYRTIAVASLLYILALGLLTLSAVLPSLGGFDCKYNSITSCSPPRLPVILFFFSLYLVAVAEGGHKPCTQAFGADQFDSQDPEECKGKSSFFNWWYFGASAGVSVAILIVSYIQDNLSWALGFGIPCIAMVVALVVFLLGTTTYRYSIGQNEKGPFLRIGGVFVAAFRNWRRTSSTIATEVETRGFLLDQSSEQFRFLNKALLAPSNLKEDDCVCIADVEEAKAVLRLVPIWVTCFIYGMVFAQSSTFFTKQGATMDRTIFSGSRIPAASLQCFIYFTLIIILPIYDRIFVPLARAFTRIPSGITMLQRIGVGFFFHALSMVVAALVELKRLKTAQKYNLVDMPSAMIPMSVWWLLPQYILFGIADVFTLVGMQEFFYDQVPTELRSIGLALYFSVFGFGNFLSSFLISVIEKATGGEGRESWFSSNLNRAHLDYFYWLLFGLSSVGFAAYLHFASFYVYKRRGTL
ncbi:Proton-dependent oligopeptide transporter [Parasponia andersonii]|uniref:Proton-dependent oligopeptide transporter n=1 Tax=Parasponia andersonii TaxID=3476 RepID=A0A2P5BE16_PARAD|nr:Proton-dependent oligopeptide transporter [Parasponia andersonii]